MGELGCREPRRTDLARKPPRCIIRHPPSAIAVRWRSSELRAPELRARSLFEP